ncbi:hypothetical protein K440DRAFT_638983 [Wilcoxina mikolae CBS 423.85]|nr:hypothetical protein K440DRAFT_638983 [Wilcoxina mikolae CBS 423.85]
MDTDYNLDNSTSLTAVGKRTADVAPSDLEITQISALPSLPTPEHTQITPNSSLPASGTSEFCPASPAVIQNDSESTQTSELLSLHTPDYDPITPISLIPASDTSEYCPPSPVGTQNVAIPSSTASDHAGDSPSSVYISLINRFLNSPTTPPATLVTWDRAVAIVRSSTPNISIPMPQQLVTEANHPVDSNGNGEKLQAIVKQLVSLVAEKMALEAAHLIHDGSVRIAPDGFILLDAKVADNMLNQVQGEIEKGMSTYWELYRWSEPNERFVTNIPDVVKEMLVAYKQEYDKNPPLSAMDWMPTLRDNLRYMRQCS